MNYLIGDIGNTNIKICKLNKNYSKKFIFQKFHDKPICSANILVNSKKSYVLSINEIVVKQKNNNIITEKIIIGKHNNLLSKVNKITESIIKEFNIKKGVFGFDFILVNSHTIKIIDVNPRLTTSFFGLIESLPVNPLEYLYNLQNKFNINLCGGDTTFSNKLSFTITSLGYSNKIIYRNKAKLNDDIYVTGNLGDSYLGLKALSNKVKFKNKDKLFFVDKYYKPELPLNLTKYLLKFANSSIDVSDGLIDDLAKMINRQSLSFHLFENKIPVSNKLSNLIKKQRLNKINLISNGDDYQVLFTADIKKARIIQKASKTTGIKITKIGKIVSGKDRSLIFDEKGKQIRAKSKGYIHRF